MKILKERIMKDGRVFPGNVLKVDSFINHQIDTGLMAEIGEEFKRRYDNCGITKVLTIEASGIAIASFVAYKMGVPLVFAKKTQTKNIASDVYTAKVTSYTHGRVYDVIVSKEFITSADKVLIIDDFLANGQALLGLIEIVRSAGAEVAGAGIVIEKSFQDGGKLIRNSGIRVESLAMVSSLENGTVTFED
ncbi:MAG: xanthine phosphoribosyltransferase [Clostridia bacterium]|nr:xanthine phosphoribosyltransferase [Clostridia bacterium]